MITIANANAAILIAMGVMLLVAVPVDPRKSTMSKWLYWLIGPLVCTALFAVAFYGAIKNPETGDLIGVIVGGALFAYLGFGAGYVRKVWSIGRWPGSRS